MYINLHSNQASAKITHKGSEIMIDLSSFKPLNFVPGKNTMTISKTGVAISQAAVVQLGKPEFVEVLISYEQKSIALIATDNKNPNKIRFLNKNKKTPTVRWNNATLKSEIANLMKWDLSNKIYKVEGNYYPQDSLVMFDLNKAQVSQ